MTDPVIGRSAPPRRTAGFLVLITALVLLTGAPSVLSRGLPGVAAVGALPDPPPVGSCLWLDRDRVEPVPCDQSHHAEVMLTWPADRPPADAGTFAAVAGHPFGTAGQVKTVTCNDARQPWVQVAHLPGSEFWTAAGPVVDSQLLAAPAAERTPDRGWLACILVAPDRQPLTGALRAGSGGQPAARLGTCVQASQNYRGPETVTCDRPHRTEILGTFRTTSLFDARGRFTGYPDDTVLADSCAAFARAVTRTDDPTFGGRLHVRAASLFPASILEVDTTDPAGVPVHTYVPLPQCDLDLVGAGTLTGTVVGLAGGPLPLG